MASGARRTTAGRRASRDVLRALRISSHRSERAPVTYESLDAATAGASELRTSQLAIPPRTCAAVYATAGHEQSVANRSQLSLDSDMVFSDGYASQLAKASGGVDDGITLSLDVGSDRCPAVPAIVPGARAR